MLMGWLKRKKPKKRRDAIVARTLDVDGDASALTYNRVSDVLWEIPRTGNMRVPARIYATRAGLERIKQDKAPLQAVNVAHLPGIVKYSLAMPDIHWGYGFPIGGVAATDPAEGGVISPGGVGYDINCGCRLVTTGLTREEVQPKMAALVNRLFEQIPTGVGANHAIDKLSVAQLRKLIVDGAEYATAQGYGDAAELDHIEGGGKFEGADPKAPSTKAFQRGINSVGTLGSGNHFLEVGYVDELYDTATAAAFGLVEGMVTVLIHTGSRGFGHQVCVDHLEQMSHAGRKYDLHLPDRQLAAAPIESPEGEQYLTAMGCAANYAWVNRQVIQQLARDAFMHVFDISPTDLAWRLLYDVCHNIAKMETHTVDGEARRLCVHRKGATRAFPSGHPDLPPAFRTTGQPVLIPGDMGRGSFVCVGLPGAMEETFGSTCHGAGRAMSRRQALKRAKGRSIVDELRQQGIIVKAKSHATIGEEMPEAYKDATDVVRVVDRAGISRTVAKLRPLGVIKG